MATMKIYRETAMPGTLDAYSIYLIAPASDPTLLEIVVVDAAGTASRHVINKTEIQGMIDASMAGAGANNLIVVDNIAARDALTPTTNVQCYVIDATGDSTVASGGATYLYRLSTTTWIKISESESMDVILKWADLQNKPTSLVADIDDAVAKRHAHTNKTQLDKLGENGGGELTYNGVQVKTEFASTAW